MSSRLHSLVRGAAAVSAAVVAISAPLAAQRPAAAAVTTAPPPAAALGDTLAFDPLVRRGTLPNGLKYYVRRNTRPEKRAELRLVVNAGSVLEDEDQRGLAHFVEHMAFNGTTNFEKSALVSYLESIGMRFGPDLNASTSFDETIYMLQVPTDSAAALRRGFEILDDWAVGQRLDSLEIEKERGVVIEEWRSGRGAGMRMLAQQLPVIFKGSQYADRLPIGGLEPLRTFKPDAARRYYRNWYRPDLMAVVAVGDFDPDSIVRAVTQRFSRLPAAAPGAPVRREIVVPTASETLVSVTTDKEATSSSVAILWKEPTRSERTVADFRRGLVDGLASAMLNARFAEISQSASAPFLGASSGRGALARSAEIYQLGAGVKEGGIVRGLEGVLTEAERAARHGFVATELAREKSELVSAYERAYNEREKIPSARLASAYASAYLDGEPEPGITAEYQLVRQLLTGVTLAEVNEVARTVLGGTSRVIIASAPEKAGLTAPTEAELRQVLARVGSATIAAYVDKGETGALVDKVPAGGRIVRRAAHPKVGVTEFTLSNGVRVLVKPTEFKADEITFTSFSPGGASRVADSLVFAAAFAPTAVTTGGVGRFSQVDLGKALAGKQVAVSPYISELFEGFSGGAAPRDLETALQLVYLYATAPRRDSAAFEATRARIASFVQNRGANPQAVFDDTMQVTLSQRSPRSPAFTPAAVAKLSVDRGLAIYRDRFADASDMTFVFVGNVTSAQLEPLAAKWLGALPSSKRAETWIDRKVPPPAGVVERVVKQGLEPKAQTRILFHGEGATTAAERSAMIALREVLTIRLRDALREDKGGTYGVGVSVSTRIKPRPAHSMTVNFGSSPERLEELTAIVFQQIDSLKRADVTPDELAKVRELRRRALETSLQQNGAWMGRLSGALQDGEPLESVLANGPEIDAVTPAAIRAAAVRVADMKHYVRGSLYPAAYEGATAK